MLPCRLAYFALYITKQMQPHLTGDGINSLGTGIIGLLRKD